MAFTEHKRIGGGAFLKSPPLFAFVDLQADFTGCVTKETSIKHLDKCLHNCKRILKFARHNRLPIAHFRQNHKDLLLKRKPGTLHWLDDFKPMHNEMIFERNLPSCYSSRPFHKLMRSIRDPHIILLGLTGPQACLSTAIEAYHNNHDLTFISDGSITPALGAYTDDKAHKFISELINLYSRVLKAGEFLKKHHHRYSKKY